jgi:GT2 family glycosyltransferase
VIERAENAGLAAARSAALAAARGDVVLLVNDDTIAFPDLLERHLEAHARHAPRRVAVLGTFEQPETQLSTALMRVLERTDLVFAYRGLRADVLHDWMRFWGCNVSVSRREALAAGAFDARFRHYGCEDTDLGVRLFARGVAVAFEPRARAWHRHVLGFDDLERRQKTVARAYVRLFARHPQLLDHPSWKGVAASTLAQLETCAKQRAPARQRLAKASRPLSSLDCRALETLGGRHAELAAAAETRLGEALAELNRDWWSEGFAEGLRALGVGSFRELRSLSDRAGEPWPLSGDSALRVLAWPRWDRDDELAKVLEVAADARLASARPCLCLRHDPQLDGDAKVAIARLEQVSRRVLARGEDVDAVIVGEPMAPSEWSRLGKAVACSLLLDSSEEGTRARFFARADAPGVRGADDQLAIVPAPSRSRSVPHPKERVWAELSV